MDSAYFYPSRTQISTLRLHLPGLGRVDLYQLLKTLKISRDTEFRSTYGKPAQSTQPASRRCRVKGPSNKSKRYEKESNISNTNWRLFRIWLTQQEPLFPPMESKPMAGPEAGVIPKPVWNPDGAPTKIFRWALAQPFLVMPEQPRIGMVRVGLDEQTLVNLNHSNELSPYSVPARPTQDLEHSFRPTRKYDATPIQLPALPRVAQRPAPSETRSNSPPRAIARINYAEWEAEAQANARTALLEHQQRLLADPSYATRFVSNNYAFPQIQQQHTLGTASMSISTGPPPLADQSYTVEAPSQRQLPPLEILWYHDPFAGAKKPGLSLYQQRDKFQQQREPKPPLRGIVPMERYQPGMTADRRYELDLFHQKTMLDASGLAPTEEEARLRLARYQRTAESLVTQPPTTSFGAIAQPRPQSPVETARAAPTMSIDDHQRENDTLRQELAQLQLDTQRLREHKERLIEDRKRQAAEEERLQAEEAEQLLQIKRHEQRLRFENEKRLLLEQMEQQRHRFLDEKESIMVMTEEPLSRVQQEWRRHNNSRVSSATRASSSSAGHSVAALLCAPPPHQQQHESASDNAFLSSGAVDPAIPRNIGQALLSSQHLHPPMAYRTTSNNHRFEPQAYSTPTMYPELQAIALEPAVSTGSRAIAQPIQRCASGSQATAYSVHSADRSQLLMAREHISPPSSRLQQYLEDQLTHSTAPPSYQKSPPQFVGMEPAPRAPQYQQHPLVNVQQASPMNNAPTLLPGHNPLIVPGRSAIAQPMNLQAPAAFLPQQPPPPMMSQASSGITPELLFQFGRQISMSITEALVAQHRRPQHLIMAGEGAAITGETSRPTSVL